MTDDRFWARVNKTETCWLWTGAKSGGGYGIVGRLRDGKTRGMQTHRYAYELSIGPIPVGMLVRHRCHVPACVRPEHLLLGTAAENSADMARAGRARNRYTGPINPRAPLPVHAFAWCAGAYDGQPEAQ